MKIKTSITLSEELVHEIDAYADRFKNRSVFLETAARFFITQLRRAEQDARDIEIIDQWADDLNEEVKDALNYQVALRGEGKSTELPGHPVTIPKNIVFLSS